MTSRTLEGDLLRNEIGRSNYKQGTVFSPWRCPSAMRGRANLLPPLVDLVGHNLHAIGWSMDTDAPRWREPGRVPPLRQDWDAPLEWVMPHILQCQVGGESVLQHAAKNGWFWVSQFVDMSTGALRPVQGRTEKARETWMGVQACLQDTQGGVSKQWDPRQPWAETSFKQLVIATCRRTGNNVGREDEYRFHPTVEVTGVGMPLVGTSDGSLQDVAGERRAAYAACSVQGYGTCSEGRLAGFQGIAKAEVIGALGQVVPAQALLRDSGVTFTGTIDNQGMWSRLCAAPTLTQRELQRSPPGNLALREVGAISNEAEGQVSWLWMKSHTYRTGLTHERHNGRDAAAGRVAATEPNVPAKRFDAAPSP